MTGDRKLADSTAAELGKMWPEFVASIPDAWSDFADGSIAFITGLPAPPLNGVIATARDADPAVVASQLDEVSTRTSSYALQARPGSDALDDLAKRRGMHLAMHLPLMVLDDASRLATAADMPDLDIRTLARDEVQAHLDVFVPAFETTMENVAPLARSSMLSVPGVSAYVGSVGGEPVATAIGVRHGEHVGIFNVATDAAHRGRGYGAAVTARATLNGLAAGAKTAFLQSSEMGLHVYEQLGYRIVEQWAVWLPEGLSP
ncbi:MAG: GNAT family N-acetyltransferase [Frankia sp.]|nr:GNAT family N-acetyltransferase [Frankia sp.]